MELHHEFLNRTFSKLQVWNGEDIPYSRLVTLNVSGVPFVIRDNSLFDKIGDMFGEVVQKSSFSWQEEDNSLGLVKIVTSQPSRIEEAVVIKWNNKSIVCWVSEVCGQRFQGLEGTSMHGSLDSESEDWDDDSMQGSESDLGPEEVGGLEEGEIRDNDDQRQEGDRKSPRPDSDRMGNDRPLDNQESHEVQETPIVNAGGNASPMHGELYENELGGENNEILFNDVEQPNNFGNDGPNMDGMDLRKSGPGVGPTKYDPVINVNLGKRNRDVRSPPSIGSTQGPTHRLFHQTNGATVDPIDLNTPVREPCNNELENGVPVINPGSSEAPIAGAEGLINPQLNSVFQEDISGDDAGDVQNRSDLQRMISEETQATIQIGALIGVDLNGFANETEKLVADEGVTIGFQ
ncbi:hypothetical protein HanRHA438_Chr01g0037991 [Helianthus annuus]|nr:hypothetical protein HanRHA438_Chr01g0037991 [Helianthus annuus]